MGMLYWAIIANNPAVFNTMVLPPAFGPDITHAVEELRKN
jgi:hypothetical protein